MLTVPAVLTGLLWPGAAHAHLVTTGLGPVYDGISHLLVSVNDLLPVVAIALLAGLNGPAAGRRVLFTLPLAWLAGGAAGYASGTAFLPTGITSSSLLVLGTMTAADLRLAPSVVTGLAVLLGILHGWLNGATFAAAREGGGLLGIAAAIFVVAAVVAASVVSLRRPAARIVVRVAGSWIAAIGLLLLGWALRGRP